MSYIITMTDVNNFVVCSSEEDTKLQAIKFANRWLLDSHRRELGMERDTFNECRVKVFNGKDECVFDEHPNVY